MKNLYYNYTKKINNNVANEMINIINDLIKYKDYKNAKEELNSLKKYIGNNDYFSIVYTFLKNRIKEEESLTPEIIESLEYGNFYLGRPDNYEVLGNAMFYFKNGLEKTNHNIFNYYIGRTYYALQNYEAAFEYFRKYSLNGGMKACKNYIYMAVLLGKKLSNKDYEYADLCISLAEAISKYDKEGKIVDYRLKEHIYSKKMEEEHK